MICRFEEEALGEYREGALYAVAHHKHERDFSRKRLG